MKNDAEKLKKALIVGSVASHIDQFCMGDAALLREMGCSVDIACNFDVGNAYTDERAKAFKEKLLKDGYGVKQIDFTRSVGAFSGHVRAYRQLKKLIDGGDYAIIHCHTPFGGVICRFAAKKARKNGAKVLYTAHGFHFFSGAKLSAWALWYPIEKLCARMTDVIITINKEDYTRALKKLHAGKIEYIPGIGVDTKRFEDLKKDTESRERIRKELGVMPDEKLIISVGELTKRKDHETAVRALGKLNDPKIKYIICGCGPLEEHLQSVIEEYQITDRVKLLGFRSDVGMLYAASDLFLFPSRQEGLPVALEEALAAGLPAICTNIRGNCELTDEGCRFTPGDPDDCKRRLKEWADRGYKGLTTTDPEKDIKAFDKRVVKERMEEIYTGL